MTDMQRLCERYTYSYLHCPRINQRTTSPGRSFRSFNVTKFAQQAKCVLRQQMENKERNGSLQVAKEEQASPANALFAAYFFVHDSH